MPSAFLVTESSSISFARELAFPLCRRTVPYTTYTQVQ